MRVGSVSLLRLVLGTKSQTMELQEIPDIRVLPRNLPSPYCSSSLLTHWLLWKLSSKYHHFTSQYELLFLNCGLIGWVHKNDFWFLNLKWIMELVAILWFPYCEHYYSSLWTFFTNGHNCSKISPHQTEKYDVDTSSRCNCGNIKLEQKLSLF